MSRNRLAVSIAVAIAMVAWLAPFQARSQHSIGGANSLNGGVSSGGTGGTVTIPFRQVTGTTDTPSSADNNGTIQTTSANPVTVTISNTCPTVPGTNYVYFQGGAGPVTITSGGSNVTLASDKAAPSYVTARQGAHVLIDFVLNGTSCTAVVSGNTQ